LQTDARIVGIFSHTTSNFPEFYGYFRTVIVKCTYSNIQKIAAHRAALLFELRYSTVVLPHFPFILGPEE